MLRLPYPAESVESSMSAMPDLRKGCGYALGNRKLPDPRFGIVFFTIVIYASLRARAQVLSPSSRAWLAAECRRDYRFQFALHRQVGSAAGV
jgi:hypothetical protein